MRLKLITMDRRNEFGDDKVGLSLRGVTQKCLPKSPQPIFHD
jgi:hypothetical protein